VLRRLIDRLDGQGKQRKAGGRSGIHGGAAEQRKGKGRWEEGEAPTGGVATSVAQGKRKRGGEEVGRRGELDGPLGPPGLNGSRRWFLFFFFSFSFSNQYSIQIQNKPFKLFLKNFINFLETTQATKNHASQLMMHNHLLSLGLLNYI
jgi:hypothetical protein